MALELNTALYSLNGVDTASVNKVANDILAKSNASNTAVKAIDYSKFNRATLGLDLYSSRTDVDVQKQVALTRAGLYAQSINVAKLNSQAAQSLYSAANVQKQVSLTQSANSLQGADLVAPKKIAEYKNDIELYNVADKNANSSNGFNPFSAAKEETVEKDEKKEFNLFA